MDGSRVTGPWPPAPQVAIDDSDRLLAAASGPSVWS